MYKKLNKIARRATISRATKKRSGLSFSGAFFFSSFFHFSVFRWGKIYFEEMELTQIITLTNRISGVFDAHTQKKGRENMAKLKCNGKMDRVNLKESQTKKKENNNKNTHTHFHREKMSRKGSAMIGTLKTKFIFIYF